MVNRLLSGYDYSPYWLTVMRRQGYQTRCQECDADDTSTQCRKWEELRKEYGLDGFGRVGQLMLAGGEVEVDGLLRMAKESGHRF